MSSQYFIGVHKIFEIASNYLSNDIWFYPEDYYTDMPVNKMVVEIIREKILLKARDEIPHSIAVEIINVVSSEGKRRYDVNIYVERNSQKGIIIGEGGKFLKEIGIQSRMEIEKLTGLKITLKLWVKVKEKWRKSEKFLNELGYDIKNVVKKAGK